MLTVDTAARFFLIQAQAPNNVAATLSIEWASLPPEIPEAAEAFVIHSIVSYLEGDESALRKIQVKNVSPSQGTRTVLDAWTQYEPEPMVDAFGYTFRRDLLEDCFIDVLKEGPGTPDINEITVWGYWRP